MSLSKGAKRSPRRILLLYCKPISEPSCRDLNIKQRLLAAWSSIADPVDTITKCDQLLTTAGQSSTAFRNAVLQTQARCTGLAEDKLIALYARQQYVELIRPGALLKSKYAQDKVQSPKRAHVLFALGLAQNKLHKNMEAQTTLAASAAMFSQCNQIADAVRVALMAAHCAEESGDRTTSLKRYNDAVQFADASGKPLLREQAISALMNTLLATADKEAAAHNYQKAEAQTLEVLNILNDPANKELTSIAGDVKAEIVLRRSQYLAVADKIDKSIECLSRYLSDTPDSSPRDAINKGRVLSVRATYHATKMLLDRAGADALAALKLLNKAGDKTACISTLQFLAQLEAQRGSPREALKYAEQAATLAARHSTLQQAQTEELKGRIYLSLHQFDKAGHSFTEAARTFRSLHRGEEAKRCIEVGESMRLESTLAEMMQLLGQRQFRKVLVMSESFALPRSKSQLSDGYRAQLLSKRGTALLGLCSYSESEHVLFEAYRLYEQLGQTNAASSALLMAERAARAAGHADTAMQHCRERNSLLHQKRK